IYQAYETIPHSIGDSFILAVQKTGYIIVAMVDGLREMVVGTEQAEVSGPVGISHMAGSIAQQGFAPLLSFAALLSINLGVINLLPLPVLDGGHLIIILIEAITRRKLPAKALMYIQMIGIALLVTIFVYATAKDILQLL
ncbi:MAG: site-2 protease family protein, partial [Veillonella sp.]|nr:site-2 protease family protein [Veillonella sp.]